MIEAAMYVALGFCVAALLALAALSAVWRRAVRLTRQTMEATSPMRHADVRAEISGIRAQAALEQRRIETGLERVQGELVENRVARDRAEAVASDMRKEFVVRDQELVEARAREADLRRELLEREEAVAVARARQRELERALKRAVAQDRAPEPELAKSDHDPAADIQDHRASPDTSSLERASELASIASLESEVTALRRQLAAARDPVSVDREADDLTETDTAADERRKCQEQSDRLFDVEAKLIAAQAEITRLSVLLEDARSQTATGASDLSAHDAERLERLDAQANRLEAENARLRAELHSNDAFVSLRRELQDLGAMVSARLAEGPEATADVAAPASSSSEADTTSERTAAPESKDPRIGALSERIGAARKRLKVKSDAPSEDAPGSSAEKPKLKSTGARTKRATGR